MELEVSELISRHIMKLRHIVSAASTNPEQQSVSGTALERDIYAARLKKRDASINN